MVVRKVATREYYETKQTDKIIYEDFFDNVNTVCLYSYAILDSAVSVFLLPLESLRDVKNTITITLTVA